jgi:hypothetical protein
MQIIEAALAFAVTMLVLSIVCSALVETIHRIFGMRQAGYRKMLGEFFDHVLKPYEPSQNKEEFQAGMSSLRCQLWTASSVKEASRPKTCRGETTTTSRKKIYHSPFDRGLSGQTTAGFMEKLGTSQVGKDIVSKVKAARGKHGDKEEEVRQAIDRTLQDIAQKFEVFGQEASASFQQRARLLSVLVAIVLAFVLHVDALDLFGTLARDSNSRAAVLATQDEALKWVKRAEAELSKVQNGGPTSPDAKTASEDIKAAMEKLRKAESHLRDLGVPIGWTENRIIQAGFWPWPSWDRCEAPYQRPTSLENGGCKDGQTKVAGIPPGVPTDLRVCLGLLLGGLLIGLGAPFWTDLIRNLTGVRDVSRKLLSADKAPDTAAAIGVGESPTPQPRTPVEAFQTAHNAKEHAA